MALQTSGAISLQDIKDEFGGSSTNIDIDDYYRDGPNVPDTTANNSIPESGALSFDDFYGGDNTTQSSNTGSSNCIAYGTLIEMSNNIFKPIEDIVEGDEVVSYNIEGLSLEEEAFRTWSTQSSINGVKTLSRVIGNKLGSNGSYRIINGTLKITNEHRILMKTHEDLIKWDYMERLEIGYHILNDQLQWTEVTSLERIDERIGFADLSVEEVDNYFAGGILVHNNPVNVKEDVGVKE